MITRRQTLIAVALCGVADSARANGLTEAERFIGQLDAKMTVVECFSLTCSHCAAFSMETMPDVKKEFINTGKVKWVYHDHPLDQIALLAAQVARYLPVDRYDPFVNALFLSQDRWAFAKDVNHTEEVWKVAGLAGMSRATFDTAVTDKSLQNWIMAMFQTDADKWKVNATPTFIINGETHPGGLSIIEFRDLLKEAT